LWRGKGRLKAWPTTSISLSLLENHYKPGEKVDRKSLIAKKIIKNPRAKIKVLAKGELTKALKIFLPVSAKATQAIKKAGGKVVESKK